MTPIRITAIAGLLSLAFGAQAQYDGEAFRFSQQTLNGTARFQGLGGNHAALGGDASNNWGNAAGLGFYNRSELSISPSARLSGVDANFIGGTTTANRTFVPISNASLVFAGQPQNEGRSLRRTAFAVSYSQQANFGSESVFSGRNNRSSIVDSYINNLNTGRPISSTALDQEYNFDDNQANFIEAAAYQLYLFDPRPANSSQYFRAFDATVPVNQQSSFSSSGRQSQWNIGYAANFNDKLYVGGSFAFTQSRYTFTENYDETFVGGRVYRGLRQTTSNEIRGGGVNVSLGAMYRATPFLQLGVNVVSPTVSNLRETFNQSLRADIIGIPSTDAQGRATTFVPDNASVAVYPNDFNFRTTGPLRASGGATVFFGRSGFLTATAEYIGYGGMRVSTTGYSSTADNQAFREDQKRAVLANYQSVINFRVGGEFRAGTFRARGGVAYLPGAYKPTFDELARNGDRNSLAISGGVGYRSDRFFADLTGSAYSFKTASTPYSLPNQADYASATLTNRVTSVVLSAGVFF